MPDFVLEALNHCLPTKEQEESVLNAAEPGCSNTLEVPSIGFVEPNHVLFNPNDLMSMSLPEGKLRGWRRLAC